MKTYSILGRFSEALAKDTFQSVTLEASGMATAANRAIRVFKKRPGIKNRQLKNVVLTIQEVPQVDTDIPESGE